MDEGQASLICVILFLICQLKEMGKSEHLMDKRHQQYSSTIDYKYYHPRSKRHLENEVISKNSTSAVSLARPKKLTDRQRHIYDVLESTIYDDNSIFKLEAVNEDSELSFENRNRRRLQLLQDTCQEMKTAGFDYQTTKLSEYRTSKPFYEKFNLSPSKFDNERFFGAWKHDRKMKWSMCLPPKHGTSNWLRMLSAAIKNVESDDIDWNDKETYEFIHGLNPQKYEYNRFQMIEALENSKPLVMLTRHPIKRLFSAWKDKFRVDNVHFHMYEKFVSLIPKTYEYLKPEGMAVSYPDFIKYLLDNPDEFHYNAHWKSQTYTCFPCNVEYTHIVKLETSDVDGPEIMETLYPNSNQATMLQKYDGKQPNEMLEDNEFEESIQDNGVSGGFNFNDEGADTSDFEDKSHNRLRRDTDNTINITNKLPMDWLPEDYKNSLRKRFYWEMKMFGYSY